MLWYYVNVETKQFLFYSSAVCVKLLLLADHKNCIWDDPINFQTTSTGQIRSSFEAQLNSPAELRQGNARTMWAGHISPRWPIRTLSFSKKRTDYLNVWETKLTSPTEWSLARWTWELYLATRYCWLYSYSRWPRRREVSSGTVTLRSFPSPKFTSCIRFLFFLNANVTYGVFKYGAGHRKVRWNECLVSLVPWHRSHP